jgi:hypothetical protein
VGRRIRADFEGGIWAFPQDVYGHVIPGDRVWLLAGDEVPDNVDISTGHLEQEGATSTPAPPSGGGAGVGDGAGPPPFDPGELSVDEVNNRLDGLTDDTVRAVLAAEAAGRNRTGITNGPAARRLH